MKKLIFMSLLVGMSFNSAYAGCYGSANVYNCSDDSGNNYSVQKYGNQTYVQGRNSSTGSSWSQTSQTIGNTTYQNGTAADGNTWSQTIQNYGGTTIYSGTNSRGQSYSKTCTKFGCY